MTLLTDDYIDRWEAEQRDCDIADAILKLLAERQLSAGKSLGILFRARQAIESTMQAACWGAPLVCEPARNGAETYMKPEEIKEAVARRKGLSDS